MSDVFFGHFHDLKIVDLAGCHVFGLSATHLRTSHLGLNEVGEWLHTHLSTYKVKDTLLAIPR